MKYMLNKSIALGVVSVLVITSLAGAVLLMTKPTSASGTFTVALTATRNEAAPGDTIGWILEITNNTGETQENIVVRKAITQNAEAVDYLTGSGVLKYSTESETHPVGDGWGMDKAFLAKEGFYLKDGESIRVEWKETVNDSITKAWLQESVRVTTKILQDLDIAYKNIFLTGSTDFVKQMTLSKTASSTTVNPGGTLDYTITLVNDGNMAIDNVLINLDLPNGADSQMVDYIAGSGFYTLNQNAAVALKDVWTDRKGGFEMNYLNPNDVLVLTYSVQVKENAPHGTTLHSIVNVRESKSTDWTQAAANTTVEVPGATGPTAEEPVGELPRTSGVAGIPAVAAWLTVATGVMGVAFGVSRRKILG